MKTVQLLFKELRSRNIRLWLDGDKLCFSGPQGSMTAALKRELREQKADVIEFLKDYENPAEDEADISSLGEQERYPVSFSQHRLLFMQQMEGESASFNIPTILRIRGSLDSRALQQALTSVVQRHESLRTSFIQEEGEYFSVISNSLNISIPRLNLENYPEQSREEELKRVLRREAKRGFDVLDGSPLYRVALIQLSGDDYALIFTVHHAISDGWSQDIVTRDLVELYNATVSGQAPVLPDLQVRYVDYAHWQKEWTAGEDYKKLQAFWKEELKGLPELLELPTDFPRPSEQKYLGRTRTFNLKQSVLTQLRETAAASKSTLFMVLLAVFNILLFRYSQQNLFAVGTTMANRRRADLEDLVGFFMNTIVLRANVNPEDRFHQLLGKIRETVLNADLNQDIPFERVVEVLQPKRSLSYSPLFQVMLIVNQFPVESGKVKGATVSPMGIDIGVSKYDMTLSFTETEDRLCGGIEYNSELFEEETIARFQRQFEMIIKQVCENDLIAVKDIELVDASDMHALTLWNDTNTEYEKRYRIQDLIETQVAHTPDDEALVFENRVLTYSELDNRANQLAKVLQGAGVGPDVKVGICLERSEQLVISLLAILKAGGAYVPLDPVYPVKRLEMIAKDAELKFILTNSKIESLFSASGVDRFCIDRDFEPFEGKVDPVYAPTNENNIAYMIYTSGTTGKPKGVMVSHRNVNNFFVGLDNSLRIKNDSRPVWLSVTSISFDISVLEIFWTLSRGMKVILMPELPQGDDGESWQRDYEFEPYDEVRAPDFSLFYFAADEEKTKQKYRLLLDGARFGDEHGFKAVWVPERHFHSFGGQYPNPSVAASAVAGITDTIQIRAGSVVAPLHHPVRIAEEWSMVDNISNGRVGIAFASGWHFNDFIFMPENYENRHKVLRSHIDSVRKLWKGESIKAKSGNGQDYDVMIRPSPIQSELPTWITTAGNPETYRYAGSIGANILTHLLGQNTEDLKKNIDVYRKTRAENGFSPQDGKVTLMVHTFLGEDQDKVKSLVKEPFKSYLRNSIGLLRPIAESEGLDIEIDEEAIIEAGFHRYYESSALFGTVEKCLPLVKKFYRSGVDEIACLIDFGVEEDLVLDALKNLNQLRSFAKTDASRFNMLNKASSQSPVEIIERHGVDHLQCTPSFAKMLLSYPDGRSACAPLKKLLMGGEAVPENLVRSYSEILVDGQIFNMYGPTETTVWSGVRQVGSGDVRIGGPIANTKLLILDDNLMLAPIGVPGDLYIAGDGVTRGYWRRAALTAERFVPDPRGETGSRMYKTGDRARYQVDGAIEYLGRADFQVKFKGFRIETAEIEKHILDIADLEEAIVMVVSDTADNERLVAYVKTAKSASTSEISSTDIKNHLRLFLPEYMVPGNYIFIQNVPLTQNGKVDRLNLPKWDSNDDHTNNQVLPRNEIEGDILNIWKKILQKDHIGVFDNFFEIGGNSLLIARLKKELEDLTRKNIPIVDIFKYPTIEALSRHFGDAKQGMSSIGSAVKRADKRRERMKRRVSS
ncbi:MupA/Atu3671 family FMN-dependent luciferase-like monooxygenase [Teredinibacter turnerae]|uniref:MupA/Atu3671 family FMN-dependent luciferase-like monooxygenase n=1 Tax=Teredinibacter turnerae TaxID=2426 RepID=UPI000381F147|nr:MupA/Atu3671 family FMN-dependent luciferase-like monooxygenase [Teredinibacter turnerae]